MDNDKAKIILERYISIRHKIAHGGQADPLNKSDVKKYLNHIERLVEKTHSRVEDHINDISQFA